MNSKSAVVVSCANSSDGPMAFEGEAHVNLRYAPSVVVDYVGEMTNNGWFVTSFKFPGATGQGETKVAAMKAFTADLENLLDEPSDIDLSFPNLKPNPAASANMNLQSFTSFGPAVISANYRDRSSNQRYLVRPPAENNNSTPSTTPVQAIIAKGVSIGDASAYERSYGCVLVIFARDTQVSQDSGFVADLPDTAVKLKFSGSSFRENDTDRYLDGDLDGTLYLLPNGDIYLVRTADEPQVVVADSSDASAPADKLDEATDDGDGVEEEFVPRYGGAETGRITSDSKEESAPESPATVINFSEVVSAIERFSNMRKEVSNPDATGHPSIKSAAIDMVRQVHNNLGDLAPFIDFSDTFEYYGLTEEDLISKKDGDESSGDSGNPLAELLAHLGIN